TDCVPDDVEKNLDTNNDSVLDFLDPGTGSNYRYVIVYEHINYKGRYEIFSADDYYLKDNIIGNDSISSIKLVNLDAVYVYEHILLGGKSEKISSNVSDMQKLGIGNDVISSLSFQQRPLLLTLSSPLIVTYSKESSQGVRGVYNTFSTSNTTLYPYIKSLQLLTKGVLKLFSEINFKGEVKVVTSDVTNTFALPISQIKSFQIDKEIQGGDLIRGESKNTVYYVGSDFKIHPFVNQFIYKSWFPTFATVMTIADVKMNQFLVGEAVWYRPGSLIKSIDSPRVYVVGRDNTIYSINNEATARIYFGASWNQNIFTVTQEEIERKVIEVLSDENFNSLLVAHIDQTL
ncbi:hypothetical protein IT409_00050, partial [Candidatus Falkowbacteria bacterium]|nr:hypothetical protein [Candidatus Falkowbacteria bacterium]